ncbi:hypothetical protein NEUTE1DRAFT_114089 [Neurospora tetrasperma FGSC 2508]|uniref:Uncharacterized protein n=1 Tax=Neurospora tetrasperma (strain FGSC 2508 / ATCC MYA-4615 / P0657) TaxID=510951 RepID=F8MZU1_NEUT8|nr:uncharacterized protein NEUTE1DRAFT_114089 [Neurospora tetrasperma FGSC 2508]EGO52078.1 hypothetical protein NEUTE1DRAFT_114089 [Neurospora tetrasperma FGSC 2508]
MSGLHYRRRVSTSSTLAYAWNYGLCLARSSCQAQTRCTTQYTTHRLHHGLSSQPSSTFTTRAAGPGERIPISDLVSSALDRQHLHDQNKPLFVDAHDPILSLSASQTTALVFRLVAGLRAAGFKKGHVVLSHPRNHPSIIFGPTLFQDPNHVACLSAPRFMITTQTKTAIVHEFYGQPQIGLRPRSSTHGDSSGESALQRVRGPANMSPALHYNMFRIPSRVHHVQIYCKPFIHYLDIYRVFETYLTPSIIKILTNLDELGFEKAWTLPATLAKLKAVLHPEATASQIRGMTEFGVSALFRWGEQDETGSVGPATRRVPDSPG